MTIDVHPGCNARANRTIDNPLVQCGHLRHARAFVGVTDPRTGDPYEERLVGTTRLMVRLPPGEAVEVRDAFELTHAFATGAEYGGRDARLLVSTVGENEIRARFVGNPVSGLDGGTTRFISAQEDESDSEDGFEPFTVLALIEARRRCNHQRDTWARFCAKAGLGLLDLLVRSDVMLDDGIPVRDCLRRTERDRLAGQLRGIAFGKAAMWPEHPYATSATDQPTPEHVVGIAGEDHATVVIRLFGYLNYRLDFPDIAVDQAVQATVPIVGRQRRSQLRPA